MKYGYDAIAPSGCTQPALTINNGIGRRTSMCDAAGAEAWSYDAIGRTLTDRRTTNGVTKTTSYTYNLEWVGGDDQLSKRAGMPTVPAQRIRDAVAR